MKSNLFELSVEINDRPIPEFGNNGRVYVYGTDGTNFTLRFKNNSAYRTLFVPSIDCLSVLSGETADSSSNGYICPAFSSIKISGWRTSTEEVRKFKFCTKESSYAGKTKGTANAGVIGGLVYFEKLPPQPQIIEHHIHHYNTIPQPTWINPTPWGNPAPYFGDPLPHYGPPYTITCNSMGSASVNMGSSNSTFQGSDITCACNNMSSEVRDYALGTGIGEAKRDVVTVVAFERCALAASFEIFYTDRKGLEKAGININAYTPEVGVKHPSAFKGFCQIPE